METNNPIWSIILTAHDEAQALEENLPVFLSHQDPTQVEVIVVDDASTDTTPDVLKQFKSTYPNLYTTFLPVSPPNPWRRRLALTIGAKAAHGRWIVIGNINHTPVDEHWLSEMIKVVEGHDDGIVVAYNDKNAENGFTCKWWDDIDTIVPMIRKTERHSGKGHHAKKMRHVRGVYDIVAVPQQQIHTVLHYFDENIKKNKLMELRFQVWWNSLTLK